jgi:diacylglycerol kinase family enzyme
MTASMDSNPGRRLCVVVNPTKVPDLAAAREVVADVCRTHDWPDPEWALTTETETGEKQAREAVAAGADVVASFGGDGTVRAVAAGLRGSDVALGLLPGGTGNLLARNLGLPIDSLEDATAALVTGAGRRIDVGLATADDDAEEVFLVMAGLGLDGAIMAGANETVKGAIGWPAYLLSAAKGLAERGFPVRVNAQDDQEAPVRRRHARMVVVGNCGTLQGGIELLPDARLDDGQLDAVILAPTGLVGWASVTADLVSRHRAGQGRLERLRGRAVTIEAERPVEAELDGDPIGPRRRMLLRVDAGALTVRGA